MAKRYPPSKFPPASHQQGSSKAATTLTLLLIITVITVIATYVKYRDEDGNIRFNVATVDAAANSCENYIDDQFGQDIIHKAYDHGSSRYEPNSRRYIIWYRISTRTPDEDGVMTVKDLLAKCEIWEFLGYVSNFESYDK
jgi:hypothetical protein